MNAPTHTNAPAITPESFELLVKAAEHGFLTPLPRGRLSHVSLTGRLSLKRDDMVRLIRAVGGIWDERPGAYTGYLIVGDTGRHGFTSKMQSAEALGITLLTEQEFIALISPS